MKVRRTDGRTDEVIDYYQASVKASSMSWALSAALNAVGCVVRTRISEVQIAGS